MASAIWRTRTFGSGAFKIPEVARVFNTSQNYRFSYQPIKWAFSFTF